jgi:transcription-repair coupling factor (superfamily II helicase)
MSRGSLLCAAASLIFTPFGNEHPYRIELFGDEVDSIRIFNPETQLSERKLLQVSILPNIETKFDTQEKISLLDYLPENTVISGQRTLTLLSAALGKMADDLPEKMKWDRWL